MRIRPQLWVTLASAGVVSVLVTAALFQVTHRSAAATRAQTETQNVARDVAGLLALTLEMTTFGSERPAVQWKSRYTQLQSTLDRAAKLDLPAAASLKDLRENIEELPELFSKLEQISPSDDSALGQRRKQFLIERLVTELQEVVEARHRWAAEVGRIQERDQGIFTGLVLGAPAVLLVLLLALALVVVMRVLRPLDRLQTTVNAIREGDLGVRCDTGLRDELGDTARAVDSMTVALQTQGSELLNSNLALSSEQKAMEESLHQKEVLLKEVHHRVKNNLQVISSLLQLQAGFIENTEVRKVFEESQGRIRSMALVHEKLYQTKDLAHINFGEYLLDLTSGLAGSHGSSARVKIDVKASSVQLDVDRAIPCGLVVNELISNCFKHGFPGGRAGHITVELSGGGDAPIELMVRDDGVGWPAEFDPSKSTSLGMRLVHILAKQLRAKLHLQNQEGARCTLTLEPEVA